MHVYMVFRMSMLGGYVGIPKLGTKISQSSMKVKLNMFMIF